GRTNIYGDDFLQRSVATWNAENGWQSDPLLASAHLVIGSKSSPLSTALRSDQRFRLVYEDRIAVVFVSQAN
ncbi:MAG TPA: hypothetical protein VFM10_03980, partial [Terriglobales bacterium]|nr:hypothetical protein [Terriglobales bacterium]